ncbi:PREDICTED: protein kinase C-binding protein 1 isoform X2 [Nicrophorus vespilloides]|uniref:Protein kinase C-binding protein 1 isoform X2 n=1 Tax=Nicrophorus vespilloides TaxID=110193 RepID=A0ABM1NAG5_NICVS|nr:PREDICTED: protein kinase C-binding protein 1 isoform X2 [Nicrophorus vespilloides]
MSTEDIVQVMEVSPDVFEESDAEKTEESSEDVKDALEKSIHTVEIVEEIEGEDEEDESMNPEVNTSESQESVDSENSSTKTSRELKSILELSKEANLDTNIVHKRKAIDMKSDSDGRESPKRIVVMKKISYDDCETTPNEEENSFKAIVKRKRDSTTEKVAGGASDEKRYKKEIMPDLSLIERNKDAFCWRCHKSGVNISCEECPRSFHTKCVKITQPNSFKCSECLNSKKTSSISLSNLGTLLKYAHKRMLQIVESEPFLYPVNEEEFPEYKRYIVKAMDLTQLGKNLLNNIYLNTNAFEADTKWILHNSIIFNSYQSKLTTTAKTIVKICKQEMSEIENCANCYRNANTKEDWFVEVCPKPHMLLWAKLKGFPFWPAKAMTVNTTGMVDVRFFGAHDRAWVSYKECYLYSEKNPNLNQMKKNDIKECIKEVNIYIDNFKKTFGNFKYADYKSPYNPIIHNWEVYITKNVLLKDEKKTILKSDNRTSTPLSHVKSPANLSNASKSTDDIEKISDTDEDSHDTEFIDPSVGHVTGDSHFFDECDFDTEEMSNESSKSKKQTVADKDNANDTSKVSFSNLSDIIDNSKSSKTYSKKDSKLKISSKLFLNLSKKEGTNKDSKTNHSEKTKEVTDSLENSEKWLEKTKSELPLPPLVPIGKKKLDFEEKEIVDVLYPEPTCSDLKNKISNESSVPLQKEINRENEAELNHINEKNIDKVVLDKSEENHCVDTVKKSSTKAIVETTAKPSNSAAEKKTETTNNSETSAENRKRKLSTDDNTTSKKTLRVVNVEELVDNQYTSLQSLLEKQLVAKTTDLKEVKEPSELCMVEIKTEPSENDDDSEYMTAKRRLLSALNISEKLPESQTPSKSEIRTRSKTDEKVAKLRENQIRKDEPEVKKTEKKVQKATIKQRARKTFPSPRQPVHIKQAKKPIAIAKSTTNMTTAPSCTMPLQQTTVSNPTTSTAVITTPSVVPQTNPGTTNMMILPQQLVLPSNQAMQYSAASPLITMVPHTGTSYANIILPQNQNLIPSYNFASFNVIPTINDQSQQQHQQITTHNDTLTTATTTILANPIIDSINGIPDSSRNINDVFHKLPPRLKPRPPGPLSQHFEESIPSSAGPVTAKINSISHKLSEYFRGMLIETLSDVSKVDNPEASIASLKLEIETLKHKHSEALLEVKKNSHTVIQDMQRSLQEEREKIIQETKSSCEHEALRRVEEAKLKQWCAMCLKEAQFYCCWNTSYCDYPCQSKHWSTHMSKCTQSNSTQGQTSLPNITTQPLILRPTAPPKGMSGKVKTTKLLVNKQTTNKMPLNIVKSTPNAITLVESGKYEISVDNTKLLNCPSFLNTVQSGMTTNQHASPKVMLQNKSPSINKNGSAGVTETNDN